MTTSMLLQTIRGEPTLRRPLWIMRQAGRYLPEYREFRKTHSFKALAQNAELAAEVTLMPLRRFPLDAAIIFADLLPILEPMGMELEFAQGEGPIIHNPLREADDVDRIRARRLRVAPRQPVGGGCRVGCPPRRSVERQRARTAGGEPG